MSKYKKNKRGGPNATTIKNVLGKTFKNLPIESKIKEYKIIKYWDNAVGQIIAKKTEPTKLIGSTLHVKVSSPTWVTELMYQKEEIIGRLNRELGEERVTAIIFKQGEIKKDTIIDDSNKIPIADRELTTKEKELVEKDTANIKDPLLKEKIKRAMEKTLKKVN